MSHKEDEIYQYPQEEVIGVDADDHVEETPATNDDAVVDADTAVEGTKNNKKYDDLIIAAKKICQTGYFKRGGILLVALVVIGFLGPKMYSRWQNNSNRIVATAPENNVSASGNLPSVANASLNAINSNVISKSAAQVSTMATQIQSLQSNIDNLNKVQQDNMRAQAKYQQMMLGLMQQVVEQQHLAAEKSDATTVKKLSKSASKQLIATIKKQMQKPMHYKVQGVVPGLAWLVDQNGHTITVRKGGEIAGYGRVTSIDPDKCVVVTTSGKVIQQDA